ncbi:spermatogenesis-associated protein 20 isoform X1 [Hemicordylus capensis]|uniref:spermatogenesis-associated protein 20 isoform X1 n=2 Tax=Hemicordylus capensis TaxID=884348 RepID=UPI002302927B|nr:spermatogenesis-associated protein 20 isoform X1 [Hemicordylus capensis]
MICAPVVLLCRPGSRLLLRWPGLNRTSWARRTIFLRTALAMATGGKGSHSNPAPYTNRLINEKSPYLLQHAHNPVDWYPWGQEAFDKAKREDKLIFLSVGYSTCHWCHVMEQESFQNEEIGQILNDNFVCIKVDREERPDVDKVYMTFVQATSSGGGWPMSVWLTPDLKPFVGGTYFPPEDGIYQVGFRTVLLRILEQWKRNKTTLLENSQKILSALLARTDVGARGEEAPPLSKEVISKCFQQLSESYDEEYGGFSESPKFPTPVNLNFLFSYWALHRSTPDGARALQMALHTLKMMAYGGIHDHIAQGFHRYSTDQRWHVPHFEKMLYDQGQLAAAYAKAFQISGDEFFADTAADILLYVSRDLSDRSGGFYSAEDADSYPTVQSKEKQEGAFCVWAAEEIRTLLPDLIEGNPEKKTVADVFMHHYGVKEDGNVNPMKDPHNELKGKNVLIVQYSLELTAARFGLELEQLKTLLVKSREKLSRSRGQRPRPHLDSKMLASWNGLMISGFAQSGAILGKEEYIGRAVCAADFLRNHLFSASTGKLLRSCYRGQGNSVDNSSVPIHGFLEDYVFVIQALFDLYEASLNPSWLEWAVQLQHKQDELFWDPKGFAYFSTEAADPSLLFRVKDDQDGAEPSPNSIAVTNLLRAASYTGHKEWVKKAGQILAAFSERLLKIPVVLPEMARATAAFHLTLKQVVICGDPTGKDTRELLHCFYSTYTPNRVLILADGDSTGFLYHHLPFLSSLEKKDGKATAYLCENYACSLPVTSSQELRRMMLP